ncbi:WD repeat-containing protein 75 [Trichinella pseudospiralis]|uniref:WD repeat-containing protein 75 n=1 Tax=Trichinella pseudospiralis TaxID=6337 RepID=A0A0V1KD80_TRIPS|nr:WD repeat-containing protein 75 [Trichinella pseudospiralis]
MTKFRPENCSVAWTAHFVSCSHVWKIKGRVGAKVVTSSSQLWNDQCIKRQLCRPNCILITEEFEIFDNLIYNLNNNMACITSSGNIGERPGKCIKMNLETEFEFTRIGGDSIIKFPSVFAEGAKILLFACGSVVQLHSTETGVELKRLMHDAEVSFITVSDNLNKEFEVFTATVDGFVNRWNWKDAVILAQWKFQDEVIQMHFIDSTLTSAYVIFKPSVAKNAMFNLVNFHQDGQIKTTEVFNNFSSCPQSFCFANNIKCFAFILRDSFGVIDLKGKQRRPIYHKHSAALITGHPTEPILATGSLNGEISVWYRIFQHQLSCTICHWHPYVVNHLVIRANTLLSGGQEQVLVKWDLRDLNGRHGKSFCARLHSAVKWITISPNSEMYAQCASGDVGESPYPAGLLYSTFDFTSELSPYTVITNGRIGELQFYCPVTNKNIMNVDVIENEFVPEQEQNMVETLSTDDQLHTYLKKKCLMSERTDGAIPFIDIASFAIMDDWMVTAECCLNTDSEPGTKIKFWKYSLAKQNFQLFASAETLHDLFVDKLKFITCILNSGSCPSNRQLAVGGLIRGRGVCIWMFDNNNDRWSLATTINYRKLSANCFTYSEAHSIMAVGFRGSLTLWEMKTLILIKSIDVTSDSDYIRDIFFDLESISDVVMVATFTKICAWSLTQYNCLWSINVSINTICQNPINGAIAAFTDEKICVFRLHNLNPLLHAEYQNPAPIVEAVFIPSNEQSLDSHFGMICCLTSDQHVYLLKTKNDVSSVTEDVGMNKRIRLDNIGWYSYLFHMSQKEASELSKRKWTEASRHSENFTSTSTLALPKAKLWMPKHINNYKPKAPSPNLWRLIQENLHLRPPNYSGEMENVGEMEDDDDDESEEQMNEF